MCEFRWLRMSWTSGKVVSVAVCSVLSSLVGSVIHATGERTPRVLICTCVMPARCGLQYKDSSRMSK